MLERTKHTYILTMHKYHARAHTHLYKNSCYFLFFSYSLGSSLVLLLFYAKLRPLYQGMCVLCNRFCNMTHKTDTLSSNIFCCILFFYFFGSVWFSIYYVFVGKFYWIKRHRAFHGPLNITRL